MGQAADGERRAAQGIEPNQRRRHKRYREAERANSADRLHPDCSPLARLICRLSLGQCLGRPFGPMASQAHLS